MYVTFDVLHIQDLDRIKREIEIWANQYQVTYTQKTIKRRHRLAFNQPQDYTLFYMTWQHSPYEIVNHGNERY